MTVLEAKYEFGTRQLVTSKGDSLSLLVRKIYNSDDSKFFAILKTLNQRFDWFNVASGSVIEYLTPEVSKRVDEI